MSKMPIMHKRVVFLPDAALICVRALVLNNRELRIVEKKTTYNAQTAALLICVLCPMRYNEFQLYAN